VGERILELVSIIIPVRNGSRWIARTIASVRAQTYQRIELIVVDDGSTDGTPAIVEAIAAEDERIRLFRRSYVGIAESRNFGLLQAHGSLIAPLDADDLWHPEKLARQVATMQAGSPKVGLVYCWSVEIDEHDFIIPPIRNGSTAKGNVVAELVANVGIMACGSIPLIRRSYLEAVGGYDPNPLCMEELWKLSFDLSQICEFAVVPNYLVGYRRVTGSMSKKVALMSRSLEYVSGWILERWPDMPQDVKQQMNYQRNNYLAHQSLSNNDVIKALRYKMMACKAAPKASVEFKNVLFLLRVVARAFGMPRSAWPVRRAPLQFKDLPNPSETTAKL